MVHKELPEDHPAYCLYRGECLKKNERVLNLLVIGPTGAGKTTLVDSFVNHLVGIDMYDKLRYRLVDEREIIEDRKKELRR